MNISGKFVKTLPVFMISAFLPAYQPQDSTPSTSTQNSREHSDFDATVRDIHGGYSLVRLNGTSDWSMNLKTYPSSIRAIDSVSVTTGNILAYSPKTYVLSDTLEAAAWFVLTPKQKIEKQFLDYRSFKSYLTS
jgi:hypothetical protein